MDYNRVSTSEGLVLKEFSEQKTLECLSGGSVYIRTSGKGVDEAITLLYP
jgi:hypothetical protein